MMDSTASCNTGVLPDLNAIIKVLNSAYEPIHHMFLEITDPIHELMRPTEDVAK